MEKTLTFHHARIEDLPSILLIIEEAREFMKGQNSGQWQDGTPTEATILNDIKHHQFYVALFGQEVVGCFALLNDEEGYHNLLTGTWKYQGPYKVIHRFATKRAYFGKGIAGFMLSIIEQIAKSKDINIIRVDTHKLNTPMISLLQKHGYEMCGTTLIEKTKLRTTFEKSLISD